MGARSGEPEASEAIERVRAQAYALLAALLARPPSAELLARLAGLPPDASAWGVALGALGAEARRASPAEAEREYGRLFVGLTRGELVPYASFYLTGFLHDRPLVRLREDMARLGVARRAGTAEPEDHIAGVLEIMAGLIDGRFGAASTEAQRGFHERHLAPWAPRFFRDLERAEEAKLYRPVGTLGRTLMDIEENAFALAD